MEKHSNNIRTMAGILGSKELRQAATAYDILWAAFQEAPHRLECALREGYSCGFVVCTCYKADVLKKLEELER